MTISDPLSDLEALIRNRLALATSDKATFERHGQRLNGQLMQGEVNMGTAVLAWIERLRQGTAATADDETDDEAAG
jgi:hypothetical protein